MPKRTPAEERFWPKVNTNGPVPAHRPELGPCWEWIPPLRQDNYGSLRFEGKKVRAHRFAWMLLVGPIPDGLDVLHHCDNKPCVKAVADRRGSAHLFLGTQADNMRDLAAKGRAWQQRRTHCPQGHPYDLLNTWWKETPKGVRRVCRTCHNKCARERMQRLRDQRKARGNP